MDIEAKMRFLLYILAPIGNNFSCARNIHDKPWLLWMSFTVHNYRFSEFELLGYVWQYFKKSNGDNKLTYDEQISDFIFRLPLTWKVLSVYMENTLNSEKASINFGQNQNVLKSLVYTQDRFEWSKIHLTLLSL